MTTSEEYDKLCREMLEEIKKRDERIFKLETFVLDLQKFIKRYPNLKL